MVCKHDVIDLIERKTNKPIEDKDLFLSAISKHLHYGTYDEVIKDGKVIAAIAYNIRGKILEVVDMIIDDGFDSKYIMRLFATNAWVRFPYIRYIKYFRIKKYPLRKSKILDIKRLLKVKE